MLPTRASLLSLVLLAGIILMGGCKQSMVISDVQYAQPIESVLEPDAEGVIRDPESGLSFSILPLQYAETGDSTSVSTREVRLIRGQDGHYFVTASSYRHVYVLKPLDSRLKVERRILISKEGIARPAFNQREPYVVLLNRQTGESYRLSSSGIVSSQPETTAEAGKP
ncbi:MAG: hypothetical protein U5K31_14380 [Balneolaceae bacterium]|nr:hypothetical protein [Balneolaceae bacterium]